MGNDGGSIPTRRELVKEAARNPTTAQLKETLHERHQHAWKTDPISNQPLAQPIVSDSSGTLYNKDTILEFLTSTTPNPEADRITQGAIQSLKDVVEVKFELAPEATVEARHEVWRCPVTGDELGPGARAVYLVPCGHAFSGTTIKEVSGEKCLSCELGFAEKDVITILPMAEKDVARLALRSKVLREKGLAHSLKKVSGGGGGGGGKKRKKRDEVLMEHTTATPLNGTHDPDAVAGIINNASTASLTAKVLEESERAKRRKLQNRNVQSLFSSRDQSKPIGKSSDFMTRGYSVPSEAKR
ncbi:Replication termination factor 2 [Friedmanniomyces endolithicus]|uniref:Replication termination factor 2 n=1 Tax=Rachicladosporium monterosium TaxID=1507873 RepID=A0ABR0L2F7_9PEZI|nr:Replication termination factor 2 [Friedmanniomyces endolithicus]KAK5142417.1 Replication termination factor 2 [Rachicladosporium monterosium]